MALSTLSAGIGFSRERLRELVVGHFGHLGPLGPQVTVFEEAVSRARNGGGPQLVVGKLLRLCGHGEHDDASYVPDALRMREDCRECLKAARETMLAHAWTTVRDLEIMEAEAYETVQDAVARAQRDPVPDASRETWAALSSSWLIEGGTQPA